MLRQITLLLTLFLIAGISYAEILRQQGHNNSGYQFYSLEITSLKSQKVKPQSKPSPYPYTTRMEIIKKGMVETQDRYLLNPTQKNTIKLQKYIMAVYTMGERAAMARVQMLSTHPELSYRASNPTESNARIIANAKKIDKENQAIEKLAQTRALLFFYDASNQMAISLAPSLVEFANNYHFVFEGVPITDQTISSIDQNYPDIEHNKAIAKAMNITVFPALVLINPHTGKYQPVFYGYASIGEIQKMMFIIQTNFNYKDFFND